MHLFRQPLFVPYQDVYVEFLAHLKAHINFWNRTNMKLNYIRCHLLKFLLNSSYWIQLYVYGIDATFLCRSLISQIWLFSQIGKTGDSSPCCVCSKHESLIRNVQVYQGPKVCNIVGSGASANKAVERF